MLPAFARLARARAPCIRSIRTLSTTSRFRSPVPYTEACPAPTCACGTTPADLDIDRKTPLLNTMAPYAEQVLICTGREDWASNLEDEAGATGEFVKGLKGVIGRGGVAFDPFTNILLTASSLPASSPPDKTTALLLPSFLRIPNVPHTASAFAALASAYLKPQTLHAMHDPLPPAQKAPLLRNPAAAAQLPPAEQVTEPLILICGHGGRDVRCGVLGPLLQGAFRAELKRRGIEAKVAQISHIGGHKFAGNVVVYVPPGWGVGAQREANALQGSGIWYGRVGPENVEGLVEETLVRGRVVAELLRGGVVRGGAGQQGDIGRMVEAQRRAESGEEEGLRLRPRARAGA